MCFQISPFSCRAAGKKQNKQKKTSHQVQVSTRIKQPLSTLDWKPASQRSRFHPKKRLTPPPLPSPSVSSPLLLPLSSPSVLPGCHNNTLPQFPTTAAAGELFAVLLCSPLWRWRSSVSDRAAQWKTLLHSNALVAKPLPLKSVTPSGRLVQRKRERVQKKNK